MGPEGIPAPWRHGILHFPRTARNFQILAERLAMAQSDKLAQKPVRYLAALMLPRNLVYAFIDIFHMLQNSLRRVFS